jgi:hypothetical protein
MCVPLRQQVEYGGTVIYHGFDASNIITCYPVVCVLPIMISLIVSESPNYDHLILLLIVAPNDKAALPLFNGS